MLTGGGSSPHLGPRLISPEDNAFSCRSWTELKNSRPFPLSEGKTLAHPSAVPQTVMPWLSILASCALLGGRHALSHCSNDPEAELAGLAAFSGQGESFPVTGSPLPRK